MNLMNFYDNRKKIATTFLDPLITSLKQVTRYDTGVMTKPEVILWPDPENQWRV